jgi:L-threonylcarbamoyladenylate synthase
MSWHIRQAVRCIAAGGIIAYPTETVYGTGCDPFNGAAVLQLLELKHRRIDPGLILIASSFEQFEPLLQPLHPAARQRIVKASPVPPVTWVLPCLHDIPLWLRGKHESLAVRITSHPVAIALCRRWNGPLVSTSANLHGRRPATSPLQVRKAFNGALDYILHDTQDATNTPSEIRDGISGNILRAARGTR